MKNIYKKFKETFLRNDTSIYIKKEMNSNISLLELYEKFNK
jgi:hypothetical protein